MKLKLLPIAFFALFAACVHNKEQLKAELDPWVGKHPDKVVELWGAPNSTYSMENGSKVITYTSDRQVNRYSSYGYSAYRLGNYSYTEWCKINFYTDTAGKKIERFTTTGDDSSCVEALREFPKAN